MLMSSPLIPDSINADVPSTNIVNTGAINADYQC
jgi:hypothetical protein